LSLRHHDPHALCSSWEYKSDLLRVCRSHNLAQLVAYRRLHRPDTHMPETHVPRAFANTKGK